MVFWTRPRGAALAASRGEPPSIHVDGRAVAHHAQSAHGALLAIFGLALLVIAPSGCAADTSSDENADEYTGESEDAIHGVTTLPGGQCNLDENHYAQVRLRVTGSKVVGYVASYRVRSNSPTDGWRYGDKNNEVLTTPYTKWASPAWGHPGIWINRDKMPDFNRDAEWINVRVIGDQRNSRDPYCDIKFTNGGREWKAVYDWE
jgi:hypothetical protein